MRFFLFDIELILINTKEVLDEIKIEIVYYFYYFLLK